MRRRSVRVGERWCTAITLLLSLLAMGPVYGAPLRPRALHTAKPAAESPPPVSKPLEERFPAARTFYEIYLFPYDPEVKRTSEERGHSSDQEVQERTKFVQALQWALAPDLKAAAACQGGPAPRAYDDSCALVIRKTFISNFHKLTSKALPNKPEEDAKKYLPLLKTLSTALEGAGYELAKQQLEEDKDPTLCPTFTPQCIVAVGRKIHESKRNLERGYSDPNFIGGTAPGLSGMAWQTALFAGLADFLVERAGDELALWLVQTFYKDLCLKHEDWFPQSCGLLVSVKDPKSEFPDEVPGLLFSAAIRKDLERFPVVAVRAAYTARSAMLPLIVELSKKDLTKDQFVKALQDFAKTAKLQETCAQSPNDPLCVGIAVGVALKYLGDAIRADHFPGQDICKKLNEEVVKGNIKDELLKIFKKEARLPPGLKALVALQEQQDNTKKTSWACQDNADWVTGDDASASSALAVLKILNETHTAYQDIEVFSSGSGKSSEELQLFVLKSSEHALEIVYQAAILDGRPELQSAAITLRAVNAAQASLAPLIAKLLKKDVNAKNWLTALQGYAGMDQLKLACQKFPENPLCKLVSVGLALHFLAERIDEPDFKGKTVCEKLQEQVQKGSLKSMLQPVLGQDEKAWPPGLRRLLAVTNGQVTWSCLSESPWVKGEDESSGPAQATVQLVQALHAMYQSVKKFNDLPNGDKTKALQRLFFDNMRNAEEIVYRTTIVDGRDELRTLANIALVSIASTDVVDALFSLFVQMRNGAPPVELLAGLAELSRNSALPKLLCGSPDTRNEMACTLVAVGTLVSEFGGISTLLKDDVWKEEAASKVACDIAKSESLRISLKELYGSQLPPTLNELLSLSQSCASDDWKKQPSVAKLRALLRAVYELTAQINQWRKSGTSPARERVGQMLALLNGVLQASADLLDQDENAKIIKAEQVLAILGDMFNGNYVEGVRGSLVLLAMYKDALPESIRRYIPLIADLANAQDAKGVQTALRAAAAPLGSWRRKYSRVTLSVSAIVGAQGGFEFAPAKPAGINLQDGLYGGPLAALGLELGGPVPCCSGRAHFSMSGFLAVIDVGQLALARTTNLGDLSGGGTQPNQQVEVSVASNVDLLDVLAPGLYWKFGFSAIPLTFGFGPSFAPRLRKYSYTDANNIVRTPDPLSMIRLNMFIGVDLNLFSIL